MAMAAASASTSATGPSLHDPLRPTPPPNVSASNSNAVPWDEQVVPALRKRLEAESAQLAERIKGSSQNRASIQRGTPDGAAGLQYPSSPASNSSGSVVFGAGAGAGSGVVRRGSKVDMDTARQRARAIRERRDSSAPIGGRDGGAYAASQAQGQNDYYSYAAGGSGSATVGRRGLKAGPSARGGMGLPPSSSSSTSSSAFFPSVSATHQQQELSSSPYRGGAVRPPSGSSSSSRVRTQSTPMQYMGPSSSRASSSSSSAAPARYGAAAPPVPQAAIPQSRQGEAARQRNGQQLYNDGGGQRSRDGGQMGDFEMVASHESRRYEPPSPNGGRSGAGSGTTSKYGEAMAPRWPSSQAHLAAPSAAPGTAAKLRSATVGGTAQFDPSPPSRLPPSSSDPQLLDSFSPLSTNNAYTPTSRSTRAVTEPPPDSSGPSPWDWDEVLPPTIARRVAQEELLKCDPSLQGVEQLIDTWDRSGLPMTQKGIRDLVERQARQKEEEEEGRGESTVDGAAGTTTTTATPAAAPGPAEDPSSSSSYSYSSMPSSNNANRQVRLSSLVDGLGLGGSSSRDGGGGQGSLPEEEGEGTRGGSTADTKASRQKQQQHQNVLREEQDGERYQHYQQQQQQQQYAAQDDGQQGLGQTSASTAASASKAGQKQQDDAHDSGCCASCVVM